MIPFIIFLAFELFRNWYIIAKLKQEPNHLRGWVFRALVIFCVSLFKFDLETVEIFSGSAFPVSTFLYCIGCGLAFWLPFDIGLNLLRGKVWNHIGRSSKLDRFNLPGDLEWVVKFVLMLLGFYLILQY